MRMMSFVLCAFVVGTASVAGAAECMYRSLPFSEGTVSCQSGRQMRCAGGRWEDVGTECADDDPGDAGVDVRPGVEEPAVTEPAVNEGAVRQPADPKEPNVP